MKNGFIPLSLPEIGEEEIAEVIAVLRSGWLTTGSRAEHFEKDFCRYTGAAHALAVSSCTAGLHLALAGLDLGPGDEVITTPLTFCATVNTILHVGATPVLADIGPDLNIDPERVRALITPRTRAIVPVHFAGLPCRMEALWEIARAHKLLVIEDAAHAAGAAVGDAKIGSGPSDAVAFSFYASKNLSTGEGGMVTCRSEELAQRLRVLSLHGMSGDAWNRYRQGGGWRYEVEEIGFKYNLTDIQAAIGLHQLKKLDSMNARRAEIIARYNAAFSKNPELELPPAGDARTRHAWHLYVLRLNLDAFTIDRDRFLKEMRKREIGCSVHFIPIPLHRAYRELKLPDPCRRALAEYPRLLSLPLFSGMSDDQVDQVIAAVEDVVCTFAVRKMAGARVG